MQDKPDPLSAMWQRQQVVAPDLNKLRQQWRALRRKQWLYMIADIGLLAALMVLFYLIYPQLSPLSVGFVLVMGLMGVASTVYVSWLRHASLRSIEGATHDYVKSIRKQLKNNIRIAQFTMRSALPVAVVVVAFHLAHAYVDLGMSALAVEKLWLAGGLLAILMPAIWFWAKRRRDRFVTELARLEKIQRLSKSE